MKELLNRRTENSKTFDLGGGKRRLESKIGAIHYKGNYADPAEAWKDIALTWEGNRITKAPYELTVDGKKLTFYNRKSGELSTLELISIKPPLARYEIVPELSSVSFRHILPSIQIPFEAQFRITGKVPITRAWDDEGDIELETTLEHGILTEKLSKIKDKRTGKERPAKGQIKIDPTWQVGASTNDCRLYWDGAVWVFSVVSPYQQAGYYVLAEQKFGGGLCFLNVTIPQGAKILSAYLRLTASAAEDVATVNSRITGDKEANAAAWSTIEDYQARRGTVVGGANDNYITSAQVDWDNIGTWVIDTEYDSPDIALVVQEIVDQGAWASGNALALWWDDHDGRSSTTGTYPARQAYSYDGSTTKCAQLVVDFEVESTITAINNPHMRGMNRLLARP